MKAYRDTSNYTPPFTVSAKAINLIADISALIERHAVRLEQADKFLKSGKKPFQPVGNNVACLCFD